MTHETAHHLDEQLIEDDAPERGDAASASWGENPAPARGSDVGLAAAGHARPRRRPAGA